MTALGVHPGGKTARALSPGRWEVGGEPSTLAPLSDLFHWIDGRDPYRQDGHQGKRGFGRREQEFNFGNEMFELFPRILANTLGNIFDELGQEGEIWAAHIDSAVTAGQEKFKGTGVGEGHRESEAMRLVSSMTPWPRAESRRIERHRPYFNPLVCWNPHRVILSKRGNCCHTVKASVRRPPGTHGPRTPPVSAGLRHSSRLTPCSYVLASFQASSLCSVSPISKPKVRSFVTPGVGGRPMGSL